MEPFLLPIRSVSERIFHGTAEEEKEEEGRQNYGDSIRKFIRLEPARVGRWARGRNMPGG